MTNQDMAEVLIEISELITSSRIFVRDPDQLDGGHYKIDLDTLRQNIEKRVTELKYDEWAG